MTLPNERLNALINARRFLRGLLDPKEYPKIPKKVRQDAYWCLRHFPTDFDMEQLKKYDKEVFYDKKK